MKDEHQLVREFSDRISAAYKSLQKVHIQGGGSKSFLMAAGFNTDVVDISPYNGIIAYEPSELVITVRAGTRLKAVESMLASRGQSFSFEPPSFNDNTTIGGMVACGFSGPGRPFNSSVRDAVLGVKIINGKGQLLIFGGQVIKNVAGYDLSRLLTGSFGTLGIILEVSLKVMPKSSMEVTIAKTASTSDVYHELEQMRLQLGNITGLACDGKRIFCRLAGSRESVSNSIEKLGGEPLGAAESFWKSLKNQDLQFFNDNKPLWRISLPPATKSLDLGDEIYLDWGGALRWIKTTKTIEQIQSVVQSVGGNAYLFRDSSQSSKPLHALPHNLLLVHQRIKHSFDPHAIFDTAFLQPDLS